MKKIMITLTILISFVIFTNSAKADTIYVDLDTIVDYQKLTFCQNDTLHVFNSQYPNPEAWTKYDIGTNFGYSPYIIITQNSMEYSNDGVTWTTWNGNTNGLWALTEFVGPGSNMFFYIYFTTPHTEPWIQTNHQICGIADTLYASPDSYQTGVRYTWFWDGDTVADGYYPSDTSYIVGYNGQYVLKTTGCNTISDTINITMVDNTPPDLGGNRLFCGTDPVNVLLDIYSVDPNGIYQSWTWSDGTNGQFMQITSPGTYWIEVNNACLTGVRDSIEVTQISYPDVDILGQTNICPGGNTQLCTNFSYDVSMWYQTTNTDTIPIPGGSMTDCINVSDSMNIMIYTREGNCPSQTHDTSVTITTPYQNNNVCVTTVDTNGYNKIVWDRTFGVEIESYNIYRLNISNYSLIGNVQIGDNPVFYDTVANPMISANRYKISAVDTCGNESPMSYYHSTIHITSSPASGGGIDITITDQYEDESGNYSPVEYYIIIDSLNDGNFTTIDTMSAAFNSYHVANPFTGATYAMAVGIPWACEGTKSSTISISNRSAVVTGIKDINIPKISIYPNPSNGIFHLDGKYNSIEIFNSIGQKVLLVAEKTKTIDLSNFEKGVYFAKFKTTYGPSIQKIVLQ